MAAEISSILHATTVAVDRAGLMIRGGSGQGKSALALQLIALGALLVSDDRTAVSAPDEGPPVMSAPERLAGLIEARGIGILKVATSGPVRLKAVVDLSEIEVERLPEARTIRIAGRDVPLIRRVDGPAFPASLMLMMRGERVS